MQFLSSTISLEGVICVLALQFLFLIWLVIKQNQQKKQSMQLHEKTLETFTSQLHQMHLNVSEKWPRDN